jgi:hypothetical protein
MKIACNKILCHDERAMKGGPDSKSISAMLDEDGGVLLDAERGICFSLNPAGAMIWKALQDGSGREQIISMLRDKFDEADDAQILEDVDTFLAELKSKGLI